MAFPDGDQLMDPVVDRVVDGRYRVRQLIAHGGMGSVYVALDARLDREVALKIMRSDLARDASFVQRFRREARSAARLSHRNVVGVYDQGEDHDLVFLAMELVQGRTLRSWLNQMGALTPREALSVMEDVLAALGAAHRAGMVHRDVKPENVLLGNDGSVKVADFGLARAISEPTSMTMPGAVFGTVAYLAPEQVERGTADARSDVYSAGLMLYEMLTGEKAFDGDVPIHVAYQHVHGVVPKPTSRVPELPEELDELVSRATQRSPDQRPPDADAFLDRLRQSRDRLSSAQLDHRPSVAAATAINLPEGNRTAKLVAPTRVVPVADPPPDDSDGISEAVGAGPIWSPPRRQPPPPRRMAMSVLIAVLVIASLFGWYIFFGPAGERTVPTLSGKTEAVATASLDKVQLGVQVEQVFSESVSKGQVISTNPAAGTTTRRGTDVMLVVSKGPERNPVPDVVGKSVDDAAQLLSTAKLSKGEVRQRWHEQLANGKVMATDPKIGTVLAPGTAVTLIVSKGREPIQVQDWTRRPLSELQKAMAGKDITVNVTGQRRDGELGKGYIVSQSPTSGTLRRGDKIDVVVSDGPELVDVPSVSGMDKEEAKSELENAGFEVDAEHVGDEDSGTVRSTSPAGGGKAPRGSTIIMYVE